MRCLAVDKTEKSVQKLTKMRAATCWMQHSQHPFSHKHTHTHTLQ